MKYLSLCVLVLLSAGSVKAQKIDSAAVAQLSPELQQQVNSNLLKAKKAKTTALVMCIGGGALMIAGGAMGLQAIRDDSADPNNWNPYDSSDIVIGDTPLGNAGAILFWVGTASALTSIHFFIRSNKKRKAAGAILYADKGVSFSPGIIMPGTGSSGLRLIIPLGK